MSLELSGSHPKVVAKSDIFNNVNFSYMDPQGKTPDIDIDMPMGDFCILALYVLCNTDLAEDDPRLALLERIKECKIGNGFNPGRKRIII